ARGHRGSSLWIAMFARPSLEAARPAWFRERSPHIIRLQGLDRTASSELCRLLLRPAREVPQMAIDRLVERSHGNPLLLTELVRGLHREQVVRTQTLGAKQYVATDQIDRLPQVSLLDWLAERELAALPAEVLAYARLAAVLGHEITLSEVEGVLSHVQDD